MLITSRTLVRHYEERRGQAREALGWYQGIRDHCRRRSQALEQECKAAARALALAYLPRFDEDVIRRAERLTGFRGFTRHHPVQALARERAALERRIAEIEADPLFRERERLVGPGGERLEAVRAAEDVLRSADEACQRYERIEGFAELIRTDYDTPDFEASWFEPRYWRLWAAGDRICAELGVEDFGDDVLPTYRTLAHKREEARQEVRRREAAVQEIHDLVQRRDRAQARIPQLPQTYLAQCQDVLAEHLELADVPLLSEWIRAEREPDRGVVIALKRLSGLQAKLRYHEELLVELTILLHQLAERLEKYQRKAVKYRRPKYDLQRFGPETMDPKFDAKYAKLKKRHEKLRKLLERMAAYDAYERFDLGNDEDLWWREFTGSRPPRMLSRLRRWYDRHPDARPVHQSWDDGDDDDAGLAVAAATFAALQDDAGEVYVS